MNEQFRPMERLSAMNISATILPEPLKLDQPATLDSEDLESHGRILVDEVVEVPSGRPTTCVEDRERETAEARRGVPGGSNIYGMYVAIATGRLNGSADTFTGLLSDVTDEIENNGIPSGGHDDCAAYLKMLTVLGIMTGENLKAGMDTARQNLRDDFEQAAADVVIENVNAALASGIHDNITGQELPTVLGSDAHYAIERLKPSQHNAKKFVRVQIPGATIDQTNYRQRSGVGAYVMDDPLADEVEAAITINPDAKIAAQQRKLARHGRELLLSALLVALPDKELHGVLVN